jgi:hypothetical protein
MNPAILQQPVFQVTIPLIIAMVATVWALISTNNRRLDDVRSDLKDVIRRLDRIDETLKTYGQKIAVLEDRSSPLARR